MDSVDVCIDFSVPSAVVNNISIIAGCGKNIVVGTTGWYDKIDEVKKIVSDKKIGLALLADFSPWHEYFLSDCRISGDGNG